MNFDILQIHMKYELIVKHIYNGIEVSSMLMEGLFFCMSKVSLIKRSFVLRPVASISGVLKSMI